MENTLLLKDVLYVLGAITSVIAFVSILRKPYQELKKSLDAQDKMIKQLESSVESQQKLLNSSLKIQLLLLQHIVYGNHTDTIKQKLSEFESIIVDTK